LTFACYQPLLTAELADRFATCPHDGVLRELDAIRAKGLGARE